MGAKNILYPEITDLMKISHICVNYGTSLFQELFLALNSFPIKQSVFYPRSKDHLIKDTESSYEVVSPLALNLLTKISFQRKRRIMQEQYDPLFHKNRPDIIHAHTLFSDGSLANHYHIKFGTPFIVTIRGTDIDFFLKSKPWLKEYSKQILNNARYIIFISQALKMKFLQKYGTRYESRSIILPNGINESYLSFDPPNKRDLHTPLELLYVGNFRKIKNIPILIKYIEEKQAKLTIVGGGGNNEKRVLQMIQNSAKVNYLGHIEDKSKLIEIYRRSDIFIMISKSETLGLVYLEAMSQGVPVIYTNGTGIDGLFKEGEIGYGVNPNNFDEIDMAIKKITSEYKTISNNCVKRTKEFNWSNISDRLYQVYTKSLL